jgi:HEAT repeat protein
MSWVVVVGTALVVANAALLVVVATQSRLGARRRRRHAALVARLRRPAVEMIDGDVPDEGPDLRGEEARVFAELLARYGRQFRGEPQARIVAYVEAHGLVDEELRRLEGRRPWRRAAAAFRLGDVGAHRAEAALARHLGDRSADVRAAACRSLGRLGAVAAVEPIIAAGVRGDVPGAVTKLALLDIGPAAVDRLLAAAGDDEPLVRAAAVQLVGLLGDPAHAGALRPRLADPAAPVREAAAAALGRLGAAEARDDLVAALADRVPGVRTAAAEALGGIGGRHAVDALLPVARHDDFEPARAAAAALARTAPALVLRVAAEPGAGPHLREAAGRVAL